MADIWADGLASQPFQSAPPVLRTAAMWRPIRSAVCVKGGTVFVTVGTTKFDALIAAIDDPRVADALVARGYGKLLLQARATPVPSYR